MYAREVLYWVFTTVIMVINLTSYIPQIIKIIRTKRSDDISLLSYVLFDLGYIMYTILMIMDKVGVGLMSLQIVETTLCILITILAYRYKSDRNVRRRGSGMIDVGFVLMNGNIVYQQEVMPDGADEHYWLEEECGLDYNQREDCINGRLYKDWIVISKGTDYDSIDMNEISSAILLSLVKEHHARFDKKAVAVYNGQVEDEENGWQPIENLGLFAALE